MKKIVLVLDA